MSVNTHCLPTGALGSNEVNVPNVSDSKMPYMRVNPGSRRGVVVFLHGMVTSTTAAVPVQIVDSGGYFPGLNLTFANSLVTDGWVVIQPSFGEDWSLIRPSQAIWNDINADTGNGLRYLTNMLHWWDHVMAWIHTNVGVVPVVLYGGSWGGWHTFQIAKNKTSTIGGYMSRCGATILSDVSAAFTNPVDFTAINTTGLDVTAHYMDTINLPGHISWGTSDPAVGFTDQQTLYNNAHTAGMPVTNYSGTGEGHDFPTAAETDMFSWVQSTLDPLFPAVF